MTIRVSCPECGARLKVRAGGSVRCPRCGERFLVEEDEPEDVDDVEEPEEDEVAPARAARRPRSARQRRPRPGCNETAGMVACTLVLLYMLGTGCVMGFYDWAALQVLLLVLVPYLARLPFLGKLAGHSELLERYYDRHPERLGCSYVILSYIPAVNWFVMGKVYLLSAVVALLGIPLDFVASLVTTFVVPVPRWGLAADMSFWGGFFYEAFLTFTVTPYLVMMAVHVKRRM